MKNGRFLSITVAFFAILHLLPFRAAAYYFQYNHDPVVLKVSDNIQLVGNFWKQPIESKATTIILINSWALNENEYLVIGEKLFRQGYQVLSYSARGWGDSEGEVDVGGPNDLEDLALVITQLQSFNPGKIVVGGISYGGGIALLGAAHDPRIYAAFSLSGWADLENSIMPGNTPNALWVKGLLYSGRLTGNLSQDFQSKIAETLNYQNTDTFKAWSRQRSPSRYLKKFKTNKTKIFISHSWNDGLFNSTSIINFFHKLSNQATLTIQDGIHGTSEASSLIGIHSKPWQHLSEWLNEISQGPSHPSKVNNRITFQIRNSDKYLVTPNKSIPTKKFKEKLEIEAPINGITSSIDSPATTGFPIVEQFLNSHFSYPISIDWNELNKTNCVHTTTQSFTREEILIGETQLLIEGKNRRPFNLVGYLYDISPDGKAKLITHGVSFIPPSKELRTIRVALFATAYQINKDHKLGIVIDSKDPVYSNFLGKDDRVQFITSPTGLLEFHYSLF